ncbi:50S ribosomal protein L33 [Candidatus Peregrinibacteria bacterium]|nr:50S ribosomal protein L33 [Candidatus Peregrinibacteria bacterium]
MPRGKNTNVYLACKECKMQNYKTRINKKTTSKLGHKKYCHRCRKHTMHDSSSEIRHSN